jgi:hypothetical protein
MKRFIGSAFVIATALTAASASAQATGFVSAGALLPTGDFAEYANTGWIAQGGVGFAVGAAGLSVGVSGFYGSASHDVDGDKTNLYGGGGYVLYTMGTDGSIQPYVFAGPEYLVHSYKSEDNPTFEDSASGVAVVGGGGVNIPVGGLTGFVEGMYTTGLGDEVDGIGGTDFITVSLGVNLPFGG